MKEMGSYDFRAEGKEIPTDKIMRLKKIAESPDLMTKQYFDYGFSLQEVFLALGNAADELDDTFNSIQMENLAIDEDFQLMLDACRKKNVNTPDFYHGMFSIFKRSGCTRDDVKAMLSQYQSSLNTDEPKGMLIQVSQNTALDAVFGFDAGVAELEIYE